MKKQWRKSSRWRAARKRYGGKVRNDWRLWCLVAGRNPFTPVTYEYLFDWKLCKYATATFVWALFALPRTFPKNAGSTTVRMIGAPNRE